jgi:hypothetical protein
MVSQPFPGQRQGNHPSEACSRQPSGGRCDVPDSPIPPGICGARFLRQQEAGASFFAAPPPQRSRCERGNAEARVMGVARAQPISPELVLVTPELREHALRLLPAIDPDALFEVESPRSAPVDPRPVRAPLERPRPVLAEPDPRAPLPVAVAVYATEALVLGALRAAGLTAAIAIVAFLLAR